MGRNRRVGSNRVVNSYFDRSKWNVHPEIRLRPVSNGATASATSSDSVVKKNGSMRVRETTGHHTAEPQSNLFLVDFGSFPVRLYLSWFFVSAVAMRKRPAGNLVSEKRTQCVPPVSIYDVHLQKPFFRLVLEKRPNPTVERAVGRCPGLMLGIKAFTDLHLADAIVHFPLIVVFLPFRSTPQFNWLFHPSIMPSNRLHPAVDVSYRVDKLRLLKRVVQSLEL